MMLVYVAGPVTGLPDDNRPAFEAAEDALARAGYCPALPHWAVPAGEPWERAMRKSLGLLMACDGMALLDGWETSKGARLERDVAAALGMPVRSLAQWVGGQGVKDPWRRSGTSSSTT